MQDIVIRGLCKAFDGKQVLRDFSAALPAGQVTGLMAPSGAGKTTLLRVLMGLETPDRGTITGLEGLRLSAVFQEDRLCENLNPVSNLRLVTPALSRTAAAEALAAVGLTDCQRQPARELSGGMRRRVAILRALLAEYDLLFLDEPFKGLDQETKEIVMADTRRRCAGRTVLFVTHDMAEALDLADVIIFMDHGNIVQMAPPEEMLAHPASGQIQDFLGNFIDTHAQKELTAADFMRSGVSTVSARRGVNECVSKMQRRNVDTLIVVDDQDRYQGTVSIADIRLTGHVVKTIEPLIRCNTPTVHTGDSAKDCFDLLISSGAPYLIVLNEEEKVDGIITKTSMTSAMAEQLWG